MTKPAHPFVLVPTTVPCDFGAIFLWMGGTVYSLVRCFIFHAASSVLATFAAYGHSARVWGCAIIGEFIASTGEVRRFSLDHWPTTTLIKDAVCRLWSLSDGKQEASFEGHSGKNIRSLAALGTQLVTRCSVRERDTNLFVDAGYRWR